MYIPVPIGAGVISSIVGLLSPGFRLGTIAGLGGDEELSFRKFGPQSSLWNVRASRRVQIALQAHTGTY